MLQQLIHYFSDLAITLIETFHYWGIFIGMVIESACIPLPSEVIMLFGGFLVALGKFNYWYVVAAGVLGNIVGSVITYWIGASGGRAFVCQYGRYFFINVKHMEKADVWFNRYGGRAVFFGRNLPVIRTFISLPAGIARMNFGKFFILTFTGCIPWNMALTYLGLKLGKNWHIVEAYTRPISYSIVALILLAIGYFLYKSTRKPELQDTRKHPRS
ncbi:DedA family protein [Desulforamulus ruminis]|uniref:DedA family protein n=1 Tax=Desulforamulus ruminis TaxID=1564 RepID=UPI0002FE44B5